MAHPLDPCRRALHSSTNLSEEHFCPSDIAGSFIHLASSEILRKALGTGSHLTGASACPSFNQICIQSATRYTFAFCIVTPRRSSLGRIVPNMSFRRGPLTLLSSLSPPHFRVRESQSLRQFLDGSDLSEGAIVQGGRPVHAIRCRLRNGWPNLARIQA